MQFWIILVSCVIFFYETNICLVYICKEDEQILGNGNVYSYLKLKQ